RSVLDDQIAPLGGLDVLEFVDRGASPLALIRTEEEDFVLLDRTTQRGPELVHAEGRAVALEELATVELVIAEELISIAVKLVPTGLGDHGGHSAHRVTILGRDVFRINAEFLNRVLRWLGVRAA